MNRVAGREFWMLETPHNDNDLISAIEAYLTNYFTDAKNATVSLFKRIHGGASRETYSIDLKIERRTGIEERGLILRKDPIDSLIDTDRRIEFSAIRSVKDLDIPAPNALFVEPDSRHLGSPFFVMDRIENGNPLNPFALEEVEPHRNSIGREFFKHLGAIATVDVQSSPLAREIESPSRNLCWSKELSYWESEIDKDEVSPQPIARAAIRHLKRNPPPPAQRLSIVHGDYRTGNFLHDGNGSINGILDWEMAHIGDPFEDLAWATDPLWCGGDRERASGFLSWPEAIGIWQESSGCIFNKDAFDWWSIFACVKALGIWISSAKAFADGQNDDPILAWSGWFTHAAHELTLVSKLAPKYGLEIPQ